MKEFTFGFKLAAVLGNSFSASFQQAQRNITNTQKELKNYQAAWKGVYKAQEQGILSAKSTANAYERLLGKFQKLPTLQEKYAKLATSSIQSWAHFDLAKIWINSLVQISDKAIAFESSMADVKKVVDFKTPQQFKQMSKDVLELSTRIPMAVDGLANIVAAGGQAGIDQKDLLKFAEAAAKMGVAFDITADQAGDMMAKWRTAFKMNQDEVITLADKINYLGNTTAASAPLISDVVTRIGPLGSIGGVASSEIAALGASMVGSGIQSEVAATGIKNLILAMVSGESATKSQAEAFAQIGLNATDMASAMQNDARGAILTVLKAIEQLAPEKRTAVMADLFGKESLSAIGPLLSNLSGLESNFAKVGDSSKYADSMEKEFSARSQTTANSMQVMKNRIDKAQIQMTSGLLPVIAMGSEYLGKFATTIGDLTEKYPGLTGGVIALGLGLGGMYITVSLATAAFNTAKAAIAGYELITKSAKNSTILYNIHAKAMAFSTKLAAGAQWLLNASLWGCPILVIAGAFAAAGYIIYKDWDKIKQFFVNLWDSPTARTIMFITGPIGWAIAAGTALIANWDTVKQWFITLWDNPSLAIQQFVNGIKDKFSDAFSWVQEKWQAISDFISKPIFGKVNITAQGSSGSDVAHNASGGIYGKGAFLTTFAEDSGESAIPHTPNARNIGLLAETNRIMGNPLGGGANITATFAPNITIQGGGDEGKIREVLELEMAKFKKMQQDLQNQQRRVSYA